MNGSAYINNHLQPWRIWTFVAVLALVFGIFGLRLFSLQILQNDEWVAKAMENSSREINLQALRGVIYDRNGSVLARNIASYNIVLTAANFPAASDPTLPTDSGAVQQIFRELSELIDVPVSQGELSPENPYVPCISDHGIAQIFEYGYSSTPFEPVKIKCDVEQRIAMIVQERAVDWPGISVEVQPIRDYPSGAVTSSIIGFLGPIPGELEDQYIEKGLVPNRDKVGYAGLELQHDDLLAGVNGLRQVQVDVGGETLHDLVPPAPARSGLNLRLTIDARFQQMTTQILQAELDGWNAWLNEIRYSSGVVIAMNPRTGEILSMVSWPTYENTRMTRFIPAYYYDQLINDPTNPLLNHAVGDVLPAGSVFKLVTGVGALNEGVVTPEQIIDTPGLLEVTERFYQNDAGKPREFVDWIYKNGQRPEGFGQLDFVHGLANSSNVYFYKLGGGFEDEVPDGLGICRLGTYAAALGYGEAPGVGLPDEQDGLIPDPTWKRINHGESWSTGDTYISSVGQGYVLATPIQVLLSAAIVANEGKYMQPTLIREVLDGEGNVIPVHVDENGDVIFDENRYPVANPEQSDHPISPFQPHLVHDLTDPNTPVIQVYDETTIRGCEPRKGEFKSVQPWVIEKVREGMRLAVTEGTLKEIFEGVTFAAAGKTGTAEYCDKYAAAQNRCIPGAWPAHAWTLGFAPYDNPEVAVVAYVYNGTEGSTVAGPIVKRVLEAYFELKKNDETRLAP